MKISPTQRFMLNEIAQLPEGMGFYRSGFPTMDALQRRGLVTLEMKDPSADELRRHGRSFRGVAKITPAGRTLLGVMAPESH